MARTRVYRGDTLLDKDVPIERAMAAIDAPGEAVWIDVGPDDGAVLDGLVERLGLHPAGIREALSAQPRSTYQHYVNHDFLSARALRFDPDTGVVSDRRVAVLLTPSVIVTVHAGDGFPLDTVVGCWDDQPELSRCGVSFLLHGLLEQIVQSHYEAARQLNDALDDLTDQLFDGPLDDRALQQRSHRLRRSVVLLRRFTLPTEDALDRLTATADSMIHPDMQPYFAGVRDHATRVSELAASLQETVAAMQQTRMALHDSRMNVISKRVTGWAALIAIPAVVTGFYGINVPFPGVDRAWGFAVCCLVMVGAFIALYALFKRKDWL